MEDAIAVIGIGLRLGGGIDDEKTFWEALASGRCTYSPVPKDRMHAADLSPAGRGGHFINQDLNEWDSLFFRTLPQEASALDPQQRLMLEVVYEAIESGGMPQEQLVEHTTGCWIGGASTDWHDINMMDLDGAPFFGPLSASTALISGRISWFFNLRGPSLTTNTVCSSGLVALDAACQSLRAGTVKMAIVGAVNLCMNPFITEVLSRDHFLSPDGSSKPFSSMADGYGRGEAAAALLLKPLQQALKDGDPVRTIIRATSVNHDGATVGVALPSEDAQFDLLQTVHAAYGLDFCETVYVEAHGTGTAAGDPIECRALERAARQSGRQEKLLVGSVKGNTGHTEYVSGLISLIKATMMIEKSTIAPTIVVDSLTTAVPWADSMLHVVQTLQPWPAGRAKRAGISSFGASGTNAHVVVDGLEGLPLHNQPLIGQGKCPVRSRLFVMTANDRETLTEQLGRLHSYVSAWNHAERNEELIHLQNLAYTLGVRRSVMTWKSTVVANSKQELLEALSVAKVDGEGKALSQVPEIVFVFTGQGAQWPRMGLSLMQYEAFESSVRFADKYIQRELHSGWSVLAELSRQSNESKIHQPEYSQTLCTVLQLAQVDFLADLNIRPQAVVGHSSGEIAAAYCSGAVTREDSLRLAYWRGQACATLIRDGSVGSMLAANMDFTTATAWTSERPYQSVTVACENSPSSVTFSGDIESIEKLHKRCQQAGVWSRQLKVPLAYHSSSMLEAADPYLESIQDCVNKRVRQHDCTDPVMISSVSGRPIVDDEIAPVYWIRNLVMPVLFSTALQGAIENHTNPAKPVVVLEVGPSNALRTVVNNTIDEMGGQRDRSYLSALDRNENDVTAILKTTGTLSTYGYPVRLDRLQGLADEPPPRVLTDLPAYAWNRRPLLDTQSRTAKAIFSRNNTIHGLLGPRMPPVSPSHRIWRSLIRLADYPWLGDHVINDAVLFPAAGYISMVIEAGRELSAPNEAILRDCFRGITFHRAVMLPEEDSLELVLSLQSSAANDWLTFEIWATSNGKPIQNACSGEWRVDYAPKSPSYLAQELQLRDEAAYQGQQEKRTRCTSHFSSKEVYEKARSLGYSFGPSFQKLDNISASSGNFCASVAWDKVEASQRLDMLFDPLVLDAVFQCPLALAQLDKVLRHPPTPQSIASLEIAANMLDDENVNLSISGLAERVASNKYALHISVINATAKKEVINISSMICVETRAGRSDTLKQSFMCHRQLWGADLRCASRGQLSNCLGWKSSRAGMVEFAEVVCSLVQSLNRAKILLVDESGSPMYNLLRYPPDNIARALDIACINAEGLPSASAETIYDMIVCFVPPSGHHRPRLNDIVRFAGDQSMICLSEPKNRLRPFEEELPSSHIRILHSEETENGTSPVVLNILQIVSPTSEAKLMPAVVMIKDVVNEPQVDHFTNSVQAALRTRNIESSIQTLSTDCVPAGAVVISLLELQTPFLSEMRETRLAALKSLLSASSVLLWVDRIAGPLSGLVTGFARSIRQEYSSLEFRTLHLRATSHGEDSTQAALVAKVIHDRPRDLEHIEQLSGMLHVPRFAPDKLLSSCFSPPEELLLAANEMEQTQSHSQLTVTRPGDSESLLLQEPYRGSVKQLADDEIQVRVVASGINFKDVLIQAGIVDRLQIGGEASGVVEHVGAAVEDFLPGDRVMVIAAGAHARKVHAKTWLCRHIPATLSFAEAASLPINHCTAYFAMMMASVEPPSKKRILIHNASGGVGQVAVQIAQYLEMEIFATVGSEPKRALLREEYGIADDHILYSRDTSFAMAMKRMTKGKGVDLVINSLNGNLAQESLDCLSQYGTYVELSKNPHPQLTSHRDVRLVTFDLETLTLNRECGLRRAFDGALEFLTQGVTRLVFPITEYPVSQTKKAIEAMQSPTHRGKLILTWNDDDIVKFARAPVPEATLSLDESATYVLSGGFGGLGRSLARLFARYGARHLAILGRSAVKPGSEAAKVVSELQSQGVTVDVYAVDISDKIALGSIFDKYTTHGPPVRGIVQAAMDLQDCLFGGMSLNEWEKSLAPKVTGTWNLHMLAPRDLDFFITLSSVVALVGNLGQSNYGAGCAFQDSLAQHRRQEGVKAVSINVGVMKEIGVVAEGKVTGASTLKGWEAVGLGEKDFHALMALVIDDQTHNRGLIPATVPTGLPFSKQAVGNSSSLEDPKFDLLNLNEVEQDNPVPQGTAGTVATSSLASRIGAAKDEDDATAIVLDAVIDRCAKRVGVQRANIVTEMSLASYGFDSLSAVELQTWLVQALGIRLNVFDVLNAGSLVELSRHCAQML